MSWFFGKKKHKDSPPSSRDEQEERSSSDPGEDFVLIGKGKLDKDQGSSYSSLSSYPGGLYPLIGGTPMNPTMSAGNLPSLSQQDAPHYLSGVPFKLCKQLENNMNNELEIDRLRISEVLSFVERLENQNYDYDFSLETGVIAEMNSRNNE